MRQTSRQQATEGEMPDKIITKSLWASNVWPVRFDMLLRVSLFEDANDKCGGLN